MEIKVIDTNNYNGILMLSSIKEFKNLTVNYFEDLMIDYNLGKEEYFLKLKEKDFKNIQKDGVLNIIIE